MKINRLFLAAMLAVALSALCSAVRLDETVSRRACIPDPSTFVTPREGDEVCYPMIKTNSAESAGDVCVKSIVDERNVTCFEATFNILSWSTQHILKAGYFGLFEDCKSVPIVDGEVPTSAFAKRTSDSFIPPRLPTLRICLDEVATTLKKPARTDCCSPKFCMAIKAEVTPYIAQTLTQTGEDAAAYPAGSDCDVKRGKDTPNGLCKLTAKCAPAPVGPPPLPPRGDVPIFVNEMRFLKTPDGRTILDSIEFAGNDWGNFVGLDVFGLTPEGQQSFIPHRASRFGYLLPPTGAYEFVKLPVTYFVPTEAIASTDIAFITTYDGTYLQYSFVDYGNYGTYVVPPGADPLGSGDFGTGLIKTGTGRKEEDFAPGFSQIIYTSAEDIGAANPGQTIA